MTAKEWLRKYQRAEAARDALAAALTGSSRDRS